MLIDLKLDSNDDSFMKILIVDDHPLFADGLALLISDIQNNVEIECCSSLEAIDTLATGFMPNLVLLDYHLRGDIGIDAIQEIKNRFENVRVVIVSSEESSNIVNQAFAQGADGYIPKSSSPKVLVSALRVVLDGGIYIPRESYESMANWKRGAVNELKFYG